MRASVNLLESTCPTEPCPRDCPRDTAAADTSVASLADDEHGRERSRSGRTRARHDARAVLRPRLRLHDHATDDGALPRAERPRAPAGRGDAHGRLVDVRRVRVDDECGPREYGSSALAPARRDGRLLRLLARYSPSVPRQRAALRT